MCLLWAIPCQARIITVDNDGPADFNNIQAAIDDSNDGDVIEVQPSRYTGQGNRDIDFKGGAITVRSTDPNDPNIVATTVIDCNGSVGTPHRGFYFHSGESLNSILEGLTIINGYYKISNLEQAMGAGICCYEYSSPTVRNCIIRNNVAWFGGGICCSYYSNPQIEKCVITENEAYDSGAGIFCQRDSNPVISNCTISWNPPKPDICREGGGIYCEDNCAPTVKNTLIERNQSEYYGGGVCLRTYGSFAPTFQNCVIRFNSSCYGGGIDSYKAKFVNCLFNFNSAWQGGAASCSSTEFYHCTFAGNYAGYYGPAIYGASTFTNCILWGNLKASGFAPPFYVQYGNAVVTFSDVQFGYPGEGNINLDPGFAFFDQDSPYSDFHLTKNSPCIDAGTNTPAGGLSPTDLDGTLRQLDGNGDALAVTDMGAYEHDAQLPRIAITPDAFGFAGSSGGPSPPSQTLLIRNAGGVILSWQLNFKSTWLKVNPAEGTSNGQIKDVELSADTSSLLPGVYNDTLIISDPHAANTPVAIDIRLTVGIQRYVPSQYPTIQAAIDACANDGDSVIIAPGIYTGQGNRDIIIEGKSIIVSSIQPNDPCVVAATVIDCEGTEKSNHFGFSILAEIPLITMLPEEVALDGLTITNGYDSRPSAISCLGLGLATIRRCILKGNTGGAVHAMCYNMLISECAVIDNTDGPGIQCGDTHIRDCQISRNHGKYGGGVRCGYGSPKIENTLISGNSAVYGGGIYVTSSTPLITKVTVIGNHASDLGGGIVCCRGTAATLNNCILQLNTAPSGEQIALREVGPAYYSSAQTAVNYSCIEGGRENIYLDPNTVLTWGVGNIDADPCFVNSGYWDPNGTPDDPNDDFWVDGDYHLKSEGWRWDSVRKRWDYDEATSRCIDAGNPGSALGNEPLTIPDDPNNEWDRNLRIDMGAYGGTAEAGMPPHNWVLLADLTNDGIVDFVDLMYWAENWLTTGDDWPSDLNRNAVVDLADFALFAYDWLEETMWYR